jgi:hypothetical protein
MAQADQTVQNATFPTIRADINDNLAALFSDNSGNTAPTVTVAFQDWIDTSGTNPLWKKRNAANNAWITLGTISGNAIAFEGTLPSQSGNAGEYLKTDGTDATWEPIVSGINAADVFVSSGNWTCPAGVQKVLVVVVGGGGGGKAGGSTGNTGQDGGVGGFGVGVLTVTPGTVYTVTVGSGGVGGSFSGGNGTAGGSSVFDTITATGGAGGTVFNTSNRAAAGSCASVAANIRRADIISATMPFINATDNLREGTTTSALAWSVDSVQSPGSSGDGTGAGSNGGGGVGGAVLLLY